MEPEIEIKTRKRWSAATWRAVCGFTLLGLLFAAVTFWYQRRPAAPVYSARAVVPRANRLVFSPERGSKYLAGAFSDGHIRLWESESRREIAVKLPSEWPLNDLAWSPDGGAFFTGGFEQHVLAFNVKTGRAGKLPMFAAPVVSLAVHPAKPEMLVSLANGELWWVNLQSGERLAVATGHTGIVKVVRYHPNQQSFITAGADRQLVWHATTTRTISRTVAAHQNEISCLAISSDGTQVASGSWDNTVKVWQAESGNLMATLTHPDGVAEVCWCDIYLASSCWDGHLRIWNVSTSTITRERDCRSDALAFAVRPGHEAIAEVDSAGTLHFAE